MQKTFMLDVDCLILKVNLNVKITTSADILVNFTYVTGVLILSSKAQREIIHKLKVFSYAEQRGNVAFTCRYFGISRDTFYYW